MASKTKISSILRRIHQEFSPNDKINFDDLNDRTNDWNHILQNYTDDQVECAYLESLVSASGYRPNIGHITTALKKQQDLLRPTENELWNQLERAVSSTGRQMHYLNFDNTRNDAAKRAKEIWENLDPLLQAYCGSQGKLMQMSREGLDSYERNHFNKTLPTLQAREEYPALSARQIGANNG